MSIDCFARARQPVKHSPLPRQPRTLRAIGSDSMPSFAQPSRNSRLRRPCTASGVGAMPRKASTASKCGSRSARLVCESSKCVAQPSNTKAGGRTQIAELTSEPPPSAIACMVGITWPRVARRPASRMVRAIESAPSSSKSSGVKGGPSSSSTTLRPASASSFATTAPHGPEPTTATSHSSRTSPAYSAKTRTKPAP